MPVFEPHILFLSVVILIMGLLYECSAGITFGLFGILVFFCLIFGPFTFPVLCIAYKILCWIVVKTDKSNNQ